MNFLLVVDIMEGLRMNAVFQKRNCGEIKLTFYPALWLTSLPRGRWNHRHGKSNWRVA